MTATLELTTTATGTDRVVVYVRQSKDRKVSISDQIGLGVDRAAEEGWTVAATLEDGMSASRHASGVRVDWPRLLTMVRAGEVTMVWLWEASRGDRTATSWMEFLESCQRHDVKLWIETDERSYDLNVARDWKIMAGAGVDSAYESDMISERTMRAKNKARLRGDLRSVLGGRARLGWTDTPSGWVVDQAAAEKLREVAARVLGGESVLSAAEAVGPLVDSYGTTVTAKRLRTTLLMPVTAGLMTDAQGAVMEEVHTVDEAPLDRATFDRLAALFGSRKRGRPATDTYPLGRLLRCGKCGNQLTGEPEKLPGGGVRRRYSCKNPHPSLGITKACAGVYADADEVHAEVAAKLAAWQASPTGQASARVQLDLGPQFAALEVRTTSLQEQMAGITHKRNQGWITAAQADELEASVVRDFEAVAAERAALVEAEVTPAPTGMPLGQMPAIEQRRLVAEVFATPIVVQPAARVRPTPPVSERMELRLRAS